MTCIKTGADVYLREYDAVVHGDLFNVGDTYILSCGGPWKECMLYGATKATITAFHIEECGSRCIAFEADAATDFLYEGWDL